MLGRVEKGSKLDRTRELLESSQESRRESRRGIRGHGARHRTGSLSPPLSPLGFRAFFPPFCSSCMAVAFSRWASNRNRDPPKPRRSLHVDSSALCLLRNLSCLSRSSRLLVFLILATLIFNSLSRSFFLLFRFFSFQLHVLSLKIERKDVIFGIEMKEDRCRLSIDVSSIISNGNSSFLLVIINDPS